MTSPLIWYVARASGLLAWGLLAAATLWGLSLSTKFLGRRPRPNWLLDLHRWLGGVAVLFTGVHVGALLLDQYVHFGIVSILVPFASHWHPVAVAWGVVSLYLLLAVELTSLARAHLSKQLWRRVHFASFALFVLATVHGLAAGTDTRSALARVIVLLVAGAVATLTAVRIAGALSPREPAPRTYAGRVPVR